MGAMDTVLREADIRVFCDIKEDWRDISDCLECEYYGDYEMDFESPHPSILVHCGEDD